MSERLSLELASLEATLKGVRLPVGLLLDRVEISAGGFHLISDPTEFSLESPGELRVVVHVDSVARFLNVKTPPSLSNFEVHTSGDSLVVRAKAKMVVAVNVVATCQLEIVDNRQLYVRLLSVGKLGTAVRNMVQGQLDQVNPVFDVGILPLKATLDEVRLGHGEILLRGSVFGRL